MKKILTALVSVLFAYNIAAADSTNVGIKLSHAKLSASGSETQNSGATVTQNENDGTFALPSFFVERQFQRSDVFSVSLGLDFVPLTAEVAKLDGTTGFNATVSAGNLITAYVQPTYTVSDKLSVFGRLGYSQGDLEVDDFQRQATTAGTASTDTAPQEKDLKGTVLGLGAQFNRDDSMFVRVEATRTDFDEVTHTNSNSKILKADAELDLISLTIGKSF